MTFEITDALTATLQSVTNRTENHGDEKVPAISLGLKITTANTILDKLSKTLRPTLYRSANDDGQAGLEGVEASTPTLRQTGIEVIKLKGQLDGWTMRIDYGHDEDDPIELVQCKVDHFAVTPHDGGTVDLFLRVGTSDIEPEGAGILWSKNGQEITFSLIAPKVKQGDKADKALTDAGAPLFEATTPEQALADAVAGGNA
jgi:hypothetical protein